MNCIVIGTKFFYILGKYLGHGSPNLGPRIACIPLYCVRGSGTDVHTIKINNNLGGSCKLTVIFTHEAREPATITGVALCQRILDAHGVE